MIIESIQKQALFGIPIYRIKFSRHDELKQTFIDYMENEEGFSMTVSDTIKFTNANLHKSPIFEPFVKFTEESLNRVMDDLNYVPSIKLTGLWGTKHEDGQFHHRHTHHNSFMAGVYYLHGSDNSSGTTFYNFHHYHTIIRPAEQKGKEASLAMSMHYERFNEGTLVIFPAWLPHDTGRNNMKRTQTSRYILSFNSMPVGMTTADMFDRYNYPDPTNMKLINRIEDKYNYKKKSS